MISFCITTYNTCKTFPDFFKSFQSISIDYEIIIIDNNSKDGSGDYFEEINDNHVKFFQIRCNRGQGRNIAIEKASGDYLIFLDADICYKELSNIVQLSVDEENRNKLNHFHSCIRGVNVTAGTKENFLRLGGYPPINCYEDIYIWDMADNFGLLNRLKIPDNYATNIEVNSLTGTISEWRYANGRIEYLRRWIEKSADIIFVKSQNYKKFRLFNKVDSYRKVLYSLFLFISGKIYIKLFIHYPNPSEKTKYIK